MSLALNKDNYFLAENTALSSTKIKDFLRSKEMFYRRYVLGTEKVEQSPSILIGRLLDRIIEQMTMHYFNRSYKRAVKKKDNPTEYDLQKEWDPEKILSPAIYDAVVGMAEKMLRAPFLEFYQKRSYKKFKQIILQFPYKEIPICGMLDRLTIVGRTAYIDDLKTSSVGKMQTPESWYYHCLHFGYFIQLAVYKWLVEQTTSDIDEVICRHIVIGTSKFDAYPIKLYRIPNSLLEEPLQLFFKTAEAISVEKEWKDTLLDWDDIEEIPESLATSLQPQIVEDDEAF